MKISYWSQFDRGTAGSLAGNSTGRAAHTMRHCLPHINTSTFRKMYDTNIGETHTSDTTEERIPDLKTEKTIIDSRKDLYPLDHQLIHHILLVLRERDSYWLEIWTSIPILVCIWFDLQLLWLATVISRWTYIAMISLCFSPLMRE
jgi:hypothetical protein